MILEWQNARTVTRTTDGGELWITMHLFVYVEFLYARRVGEEASYFCESETQTKMRKLYLNFLIAIRILLECMKRIFPMRSENEEGNLFLVCDATNSSL